MPEDRIQREIEDILSKLDDLPAERKPIPMRRRQRQAASAVGGVVDSLTALSVKNVMLASLALMLIGFITSQAYSEVGKWTLIAGVLLFVGAIGLSVMSRRSGGGAGPPVEKRWRGQPMYLEEASFGDRVRGWFKARRR